MAARNNPRNANGHARRRIREAIKRRGEPCGICGMPIDYGLPAGHPMSFEVDEIVPVSRFREGGYPNPQACALDPGNCRPAHRICNQKRGDARKHEPKRMDVLPLPRSREW